jgi:hypothetical protein
MGIPAPIGVAASGAPPAGDQANAVLSGQITGVGPTAPFAFRGPMNLAIWASLVTALTTTAASLSASVGSGSGLAAGIAVYSPAGLVPPGTVAGVVSGTTLTLVLPPNAAETQIGAGTDNNASFTGAAIAWSGTVQLERSFDGGNTWIVCNAGSAGALAQWTAGPISTAFGEPEKQVLYRLNCTAYSSGTINYRISETGGAATSLDVGQLT